MGDVVLSVVRWSFRISFLVAVILATIALYALVINYLIIGFNMTVLGDIFALIQIWLPFNLNIVLIWLSLAATTYIAYRVSVMSYVLLNTFIGRG